MFSLLIGLLFCPAHSFASEMKLSQSIEAQTQREAQEKIALEAYDLPTAKVYFLVAFQRGVPVSRKVITQVQFENLKKRIHAILRTSDEGICDRPYAWTHTLGQRASTFLFCAESLSTARRRQLEQWSNSILNELKAAR